MNILEIHAASGCSLTVQLVPEADDDTDHAAEARALYYQLYGTLPIKTMAYLIAMFQGKVT